MLGAPTLLCILLTAAPTASPMARLVPDLDAIVLSQPLVVRPDPPDHRVRWTLVGALSGAALGVAVGFINLHGESAFSSDHRDVFVGALVGGAVGALLGNLLAPRFVVFFVTLGTFVSFR